MNSDSDSDDEQNTFAAIDDIENLAERDEDDADFSDDDEGGFGDGDDMKDPLSEDEEVSIEPKDDDDLSQLQGMLKKMGGIQEYGEALAQEMKTRQPRRSHRQRMTVKRPKPYAVSEPYRHPSKVAAPVPPRFVKKPQPQLRSEVIAQRKAAEAEKQARRKNYAKWQALLDPKSKLEKQ